METLKIKLLSLTIVLALLSCGGTTNNLASGEFSKIDNYKINSYAGCCGCKAKYFNIYQHKQIQEQIIYKYNCYTPGLPTKYVFNYKKSGNLVDCDKYIATANNDFEIALTGYETTMFSLLDSDTLKFGNKTMQYSEIKGFRKAKDKEVTHSFPLIKKGYNLTVK